MAGIVQTKSVFGAGIGRICAVAAASTAAEMSKLVRLGLRETPTIELRLDWLCNDSERADLLQWVKRNKLRNATFLATCRRREGGGNLHGGIQAELRLLAQAHEAGCTWCDLEVETLRELRGKSLSQLGLPPKILLSLHDFQRMPARLGAISSSVHSEAAALKIAAHSRTFAESLRLLGMARRSRNLVAVPMGDVGLPARILALREGSALAYAPIGEATEIGRASCRERV